MAWFCIDDGFAFNAKVIAAGNEACGAWMRAGAWSGAPSNLTDGYIPREVAHQIAKPSIWQKLIDAKAGKEHGLIEPRPDGYQIHDYLDYNPSAEKVRAKRAAWAQRQKKSRGVTDLFDAESQADNSEKVEVSRRDMSVTHHETPGLSQRSPFPIPHSPDQIPPTPPAGGTSKPRGQPRRAGKLPAVRMPQDWTPRDEERDQATELGLDVEREAGKFANFHESKGNVFASWDAAFRNWLDKAAEFRGPRSTPTRRPNDPPPITGRVIERPLPPDVPVDRQVIKPVNLAELARGNKPPVSP